MGWHGFCVQVAWKMAWCLSVTMVTAKLCSELIPMSIWIRYSIQCGAVIMRSYKYSQKTPHSSPVRARYGVPYGVHKKASDWYFASVPVVIHVISWNIEPYHNGTRLYIQWHRICTWFCCALFRCGCAISQWWIHKDTLPLFVRIALPTLEILMIFLLSVKQFWRIRAKLTTTTLTIAN